MRRNEQTINPQVLTWARRGFPTLHPYVVGRNILAKNRLVFHAIKNRDSAKAEAIEKLTPAVDEWYRWRTKQAANQWRNRRPHLIDLEVRNLDSENVVRAGRKC
jgi:hypothetical protein